MKQKDLLHGKNTKKQTKLAREIQMFTKDVREQKWVYIMAIPVIIYFIIFHYVPMYGAVIAFKNFSMRLGIMGSPWAANHGFEHFITFVTGPYFKRLMVNTLEISVFDIIFGFPAPIIFAILLNELTQVKFKKLVQTLTYLPHFISMMVLCGLISIFTAKTGPVAQFVALFTGAPENLLYRPEYFKPIYIISGIWQQLGWSSIIYIAALTNVDANLYEAAELDGAGRFRKIISVSIPAIMPTIVTLFILRIGSLMTVGYEKVLLLQNDLTLEASDVISTYVYRSGVLESNYSFSTAVGLMNAVINFAVLILANQISKKVSETSLW